MNTSLLFLAIVCSLLHTHLVCGLNITKRCVNLWDDDWNMNYCDDLDLMANVTCWHNWRPNLDYSATHTCRNAILAHSHNFVPLFWGNYPYTAPSNASHIIGYNEANNKNQAGMSPTLAAEKWIQLTEAYKDLPNVTLVGPSVMKCSKVGKCDFNGTDWLLAFDVACNNSCRVDVMNIHYYGACNKAKLEQYVDQVYGLFGKRIWVTEYACSKKKNLTPTKVATFMNEALEYLEESDKIYRHSWYKIRNTNDSWVNPLNSLLNSEITNATSTRTAIGTVYNTP